MNMRISSFSLIALIGILFGCEKDDICSGETATTPRLVIECFDAANPNTPKNVNNLVVKAIGLSGTIVFNGVSKIYVPIDTNNDTTQLELIQNGNDTDASNDNIDLLTLNYTRTTVCLARMWVQNEFFTFNQWRSVYRHNPRRFPLDQQLYSRKKCNYQRK